MSKRFIFTLISYGLFIVLPFVYLLMTIYSGAAST
jgi:hypothetical protein